MVLEFPRPTYPGDFVSCNVYRRPSSSFVKIFDPGNVGPLELTLPHDGLVANQFYEIVFGPFSYSISLDAELALDIAIVTPAGDFGIYHQTFVAANIFQFVPVANAYFQPQIFLDYLATLDLHYTIADLGALKVQFGFAGGVGTSAILIYGQSMAGTVFALRPVDETDNDTFRIITEGPMDPL